MIALSGKPTAVAQLPRLSAKRIRYQDVVQNRRTSFHFLVQAGLLQVAQFLSHATTRRRILGARAIMSVHLGGTRARARASANFGTLCREKECQRSRFPFRLCGRRSIRFSGDDLPAEEIPSTRRGRNVRIRGYPLIRRYLDASRRRGWVQHGGRASSRKTSSRQVQPLQLARSSASY